MKKKTNRIYLILLGAILALALAASVISSVRTNAEYTYTVRIFAGNQGTIVGGDSESMITFTGLAAGETVPFNPFDSGQLQLKNSNKYYVLGLKESGKDNFDAEHPVIKINEAIKVDSDKDYVVAYGVLGNSVAYTIIYQDEDGNKLGEETYYGNVGDEAVIAFKYFENFVPNEDSREQSFTLTDNAADNKITFIYSKAEEQTQETSATEPTSGTDNTDSTDGTSATQASSETTTTSQTTAATSSTAETTTAAGAGGGNNGSGDNSNGNGNGNGSGSNGSGNNNSGNGSGNAGNGETSVSETTDIEIIDTTGPQARPDSGLGAGAIAAIAGGGIVLIGLIILIIILASRKKSDQ